MIFNLNGFIIGVDVDRTRRFYSKLDEITSSCSCDNCRNYLLATEDFPREVLEFFNKLGVDVRKAPEVYKIFGCPEENCVYYNGFYHICGELIKDRRKENIHDFTDEGATILTDDDYYSISDDYSVHFVDDIDLPEEELSLPAFQMEITFSKVPWKLNKPLSVGR